MDLIGNYREICKEATSAVDTEIKQQSLERRDGDPFFYRYIQKHPQRSVLIAGLGTFAFTILGAAGLIWLKASAVTVEITLIILSLIQFGSPNLIIIAYNRLNFEIPFYFRWQMRATKVRKLWFQKGYDLATLKKAVELDVFFRQFDQQLYLGLITVFLLFLTLAKPLTGQDFIMPIVQTFPYSLPVYTLLFSFILFLFFFYVYVPLQWSRQLGECITKEAFTDNPP
jgi:hypothetical protein